MFKIKCAKVEEVKKVYIIEESYVKLSSKI